MVTVQTNINPNKLEAFGKDMTLTQAERQLVGLTYAKLAFDVKQCVVDRFCQGENVVDDDLSISVVVNDKS